MTGSPSSATGWTASSWTRSSTPWPTAASGSPGGMSDWIADRRTQGKTWRAIARELDQRTDHRVDVTYETLRIWAGERIAS